MKPVSPCRGVHDSGGECCICFHPQNGTPLPNNPPPPPPPPTHTHTWEVATLNRISLPKVPAACSLSSPESGLTHPTWVMGGGGRGQGFFRTVLAHGLGACPCATRLAHMPGHKARRTVDGPRDGALVRTDCTLHTAKPRTVRAAVAQHEDSSPGLVPPSPCPHSHLRSGGTAVQSPLYSTRRRHMVRGPRSPAKGVQEATVRVASSLATGA